MTQDVFLTLNLFIDLGRGLTQLLKHNNKEPDELIRAKQGSVATQQHLLFFVFALSSDTSLHSTRLRLVDTPTLTNDNFFTCHLPRPLACILSSPRTISLHISET